MTEEAARNSVLGQFTKTFLKHPNGGYLSNETIVAALEQAISYGYKAAKKDTDNEAIAFATWLFSQRQIRNDNELGQYPAITAQFPDYTLFTYWTEDRRYRNQFFTIEELYQIFLKELNEK
jgi:hypothetical protein